MKLPAPVALEVAAALRRVAASRGINEHGATHSGICGALSAELKNNAILLASDYGLRQMPGYDLAVDLIRATGRTYAAEHDRYLFEPFDWTQRVSLCIEWAEYLEGVAKGELA